MALASFFFRLSGRQRIVGLLAVAILVVAGIALLRPDNAPDSTLTVVRGSISETVSVTGQLEPVHSVDLSFQSSGRITQVPAHVGDIVTQGAVLAVIDNAENSARLRDAQATLLARQAELNELLQGARPEDIAIYEAELSRAQQRLRDEYTDAYHTLQDALADADTAFHAYLDTDIFEPVGTYTDREFRLTFSCFCNQLDLTVNAQRGSVEDDLEQWRDDLLSMVAGASDDNVLAQLRNASQYLQRAMTMLDNLSIVLNHPTVGLEDATAATYRDSLTLARSNVSNAQASVTDRIQSIYSGQLDVSRATSELQGLRSGSTVHEIDAQRAHVLAAQAQVDQIRALIEKNIIKSPIAGTVTRVDAKVGQSATANVVLVSVVSVSQLEMTANIPEVDIGKVTVGNRIDFTVDALQGESFIASVSYIDPAETVIDGVVNYKITSMLPPDGGRLKSGLTVNMDIRTRHSDDALILPQYAIIQNDDGTFVEKLEGGTGVRVPVQLGLRSTDGMVEIVSGVSEGDRVANVGLKQ